MEDEQKNQTAEPKSEEIPAQPYKPFYLKTKIEDMMKYGKKAVALFPRRERHRIVAYYSIATAMV